MKTPVALVLALLPALCACSFSVRLPSVHEPFSSPKWSRCAGELTQRQARGLLDDFFLETKSLVCRAAVSASLGQVDESVELFTEAGVRDKEDFRPYFLAGRVLADSGRFEEALTSYERAARRNSSLSVPTHELGTRALATSGPVAAADFLRKAEARGLCDYECQGLLARTHHAAGQPVEARKVYEQMIRSRPNEPGAFVGLAALENAAGRFQAEAEQLTKARDAAAYKELATAQRAEILYSLAFAQYNAGQFDRAASALSSALELDDSRDLWHLLRGWIELKRDQPEAANAAFRKARSVNRRLPAAWVGLGDAALLEGDTQEALESFQKASELDPTDAVTVLKVAYTQALLGQTTQARELVQHAARLDRERLPAELIEAVSALLEEVAVSDN